jgi:hypothetical protein
MNPIEVIEVIANLSLFSDNLDNLSILYLKLYLESQGIEPRLSRKDLTV